MANNIKKYEKTNPRRLISVRQDFLTWLNEQYRQENTVIKKLTKLREEIEARR